MRVHSLRLIFPRFILQYKLPGAEDISKIADSDVFVYVGGESDEWVEDALKETSGSKTEAINLMVLLGEDAKEEEVKEGMQEAILQRG